MTTPEKKLAALRFVQQPGATVEGLFVHMGGAAAAVTTYQWMHRERLIAIERPELHSDGNLTLTEAGAAELAKLEAS